MTAVVYVDNIAGADALIARLTAFPAQAHIVMINVLRSLSQEIKGQAQRQLVQSKHVRTRQTLQSITAKVDTVQLIAKIGTNNIVGLFLEKGTQPHVITAKNAMALALPVGKEGGFVRSAGQFRATGSARAGATPQFAVFRSVHHPGQAATPFLHPAFLSSTPFREALLMNAGNQITKFLAGHGATV